MRSRRPTTRSAPSSGSSPAAPPAGAGREREPDPDEGRARPPPPQPRPPADADRPAGRPPAGSPRVPGAGTGQPRAVRRLPEMVAASRPAPGRAIRAGSRAFGLASGTDGGLVTPRPRGAGDAV